MLLSSRRLTSEDTDLFAISRCYLSNWVLYLARLLGTSATDISSGQLRRLRCLESDTRERSELTSYNRKGIRSSVAWRYENSYKVIPINPNVNHYLIDLQATLNHTVLSNTNGNGV